MKKSIIILTAAVSLFAGTTGCGSNESSEAKTSKAPPATQQETTREEPEITYSLPTGISHVLDDDNCDVFKFQAGDKISGNVNEAYSFAKLTEGNDYLSLNKYGFYAVRINGSFIACATPTWYFMDELEDSWAVYDAKEAQGLSDEELAEYIPNPVRIKGRVEPMFDELEEYFKEWFMKSYTDANEQTYREYCQNLVYIVEENN